MPPPGVFVKAKQPGADRVNKPQTKVPREKKEEENLPPVASAQSAFGLKNNVTMIRASK